MNQPYVQILLRSNQLDARNASFLLSNDGGSAAKNLKFLLETPQKIVRFTNLSTENATLTNTSTIIEANMKRLAEGNGSFININLTMAHPTKNYHVFTTFDQGSATGTWSLKPRFPAAMLLYITLPLYIVGGAIVILIYYRRRGKRLLKLIDKEVRYLEALPKGSWLVEEKGRMDIPARAMEIQRTMKWDKRLENERTSEMYKDINARLDKLFGHVEHGSSHDHKAI